MTRHPGADVFDEDDRLAYFDALHAGFLRAMRVAGGPVEQYFDMAGSIVCVRGAGPALAAELTHALAHLGTVPQPAAFTICVWDDASTGTRLPMLVRLLVSTLQANPWEKVGRRREINDYDGTRVRTSFFPGPDILSAVDLDRNLGLYWIQAPEQLPYWERGSPFLSLLSWWMAVRGQHYIHAGAVGHPDGGVLLAGRGGSGKSTSALSCIESELVYASDDYCLVSEGAEPYVSSIYSTAKLKGTVDFERFPHLRDRCSNLDRVGDEKAVMFLNDHYASGLVPGFPIRALMLPRVVGTGETSVSPATSIEAFRALAPSSLMQVPGAGPRMLQMLNRLVKTVPSFHLSLGANPADIPHVIAGVLSELRDGRVVTRG